MSCVPDKAFQQHVAYYQNANLNAIPLTAGTEGRFGGILYTQKPCNFL